MDQSSTTQHPFFKGFQLSKFYLITSIIKFPCVISKNNIFNSFLSIFLVGAFCSTVANILLRQLSLTGDKKNYLELTIKIVPSLRRIVKLTIFCFRCTALSYVVDLSLKFLISLNLDVFSHILEPRDTLLFILFITLVLKTDLNKRFPPVSRNYFSFISACIIIGSLLASSLKNITLRDKLHNSSKSFFDSFPLTFICFAQQLNLTPILPNESNLSLIACGLFSTIFYLILGTAGFLLKDSPPVNFFQCVQSFILRAAGSLVFLFCNLATFKPLVNLIVSDIMEFCPAQVSTERSSMMSMIFATIFTIFGIRLVASKLGLLCCLIFSALIMNVIPSVMYLTSASKNKKYSTLAVVNFLFGVSFIIREIRNTVPDMMAF